MRTSEWLAMVSFLVVALGACAQGEPITADETEGGGTGGSGGALVPGTGGSAPGTGGSAPGTGGNGPDTGGIAPGTGGSAPGTGGGSGACALQSSNPTCNTCIESRCLAECNTCEDDQQCTALLACVNACSDSACTNSCYTQYAAGEAALLAFLGNNGCLATRCAAECEAGASCTLTTNNTDCDGCLTTMCNGQCANASDNADAMALLDCYDTCGTDACYNSCDAQHPTGATLLNALGTCLESSCLTQCGSGSTSCGISSGIATCDSCINGQCYSECATCASNQQCLDLLDCVNNCSDSTCQSSCINAYPNGLDDLLGLLGSSSGCITLNCSFECG